MNRRAALVTPAIAALASMALTFACGADSALTDGAFAPRGDASAAPSSGDDAGAENAIGTGSGVVLVHAAAFPSFRLCFENLPELRPQPEARVMPNANVVGVEIGSVARIDPLRPPGKVFVIDERQVRSIPGGDSDPPCGQRICSGSTCLRLNADYNEAGSIDVPLGQGRVHVLAIAGCGADHFIDPLGVPSSDCGAAYDPTTGSLTVRTLELMPLASATDTSLPVQIVHLSTPLEDTRGEARIEVAFGPLDGGPSQRVAESPTLFAAAPPVTLDLDQREPSVYGTHGFRVALRAGDAGADAAPSFEQAQSLAEVQDLADPTAVPTTYYRVASNYALLLLGDPRITKVFADGGPNDAYVRRGLHLLAVPVREPTEAGAPEAPSEPADAATTD